MASLQVKFSALVITILTIACVWLAWQSTRHERASLEAEIDKRGHAIATHLAGSAKEPLLSGNELTLDALVRATGAGEGIIGVQIVNRKSVVATALDDRERGSMRDLIAPGNVKESEVTLVRHGTTVLYASPIFFSDVFIGEAQVEFDLSVLIDPVIRESRRQLIIGAILVILIGVASGIAFVKLLVGPLQRLRAGVEKLSHGDLSVRVPPTSSDEVGELTRAFNKMGESLQQKERLQSAFGRYVNEHVLTHLLESPDGGELLGVEREVSVLFVDICGFTRMSEGMDAHNVVTMLNEIFQLVSDQILEHGGTIDKFIGDSVMAYFGAPIPQRDHAHSAVRAAMDIQSAIATRNRRLASNISDDPQAESGSQSVPQAKRQEVQLGIGVHSGKVVVGNIGSDRRTDFTAIGDTVNVANRLETLAKPGQILVSEAVQRDVRSVVRLQFEGERQLSGRQESVHVYSVGDKSKNSKDSIEEANGSS